VVRQALLLVINLAIVPVAAAQPVPAVGVDLDHTHEAVAASVRDAPQLTVFDDVRASVRDGVVTLTGKVTQPSKRDAVRRTVERIQGVRGVDDRIAVLPASRTDDELRERIARSIYGHAAFWRYAMMIRPPVRIIVESGDVLLTGVVQTESERSLARALAMQSGARSVADRMETR
jgi:osmotically-inducible protein OsmY